MGEMDFIIKEFLVESNENLDQLDHDLVELESNPTSQELLGRIFRTVHSIKGTTGFLGFTKLGGVAHAGEHLLSRLRDGALVLHPATTTGLLSLVDALREMLTQIAEKGTEGNRDYTGLTNTLIHLSEGTHVGKDPPVPSKPVSRSLTSATGQTEAGETASPVAKIPPNELAGESGGGITQKQNTRASSRAAAGSNSGPQETPVSRERQAASAASLTGGSLRVDVHHLDDLMGLVGELVLTRNRVLQICQSHSDAASLATSQRLNVITSELQQGITKVRMQPIHSVWHKFPRLVRDLAVQCGKQVRLQMVGQETELDKGIIEAIQDPLTHLVRNAVDHGIETPEVRLVRGKPAEGCLELRAFRELDRVNIEISDDGAGIDADRVRQEAIDRKLITPDRAALLNARDTINLILLPGLSTAKSVTDISGRGVGMDVVKSNIERIGGTIEIESQEGAGTTIKIGIPLTLAIIPALLVTACGGHYAIPQVSVIELVRLGVLENKARIENVQGLLFYRLREELLPFRYLDAELQMHERVSEEGRQKGDDGAGVMVVLQSHDRQFGVMVDQVDETEEIIVRALEKRLKGVPLYAGATILGDGKVALILDVPALARRVCTTGDTVVRDPATRKNDSQTRAAETRPLLILEHRRNERVALPVSQVIRLQQFPRSHIERAGRQEMIQYDGGILPVFRICDLLADGQDRQSDTRPSEADDGKMDVIVCRRNGRAVGLMVERVLDIVEHDVSRRDSAGDHAMVAPAVINGRVTRILNVEDLFCTADPGSRPRPALVNAGA